MDEAIKLLLEGCKMAKNLDASLAAANMQPEHLFSSCTEIIRVFSMAKENIPKILLLPDPQQSDRYHPNITAASASASASASGVQEWLNRSHTPAMDLLQAQLLAAPGSSSTTAAARTTSFSLFPVDPKMKGVVVTVQDHDDQDAGGALAEVVGLKRLLGSGGGHDDDQVGAATPAGGPSPRGSSSQRQRRRTDGAARRVVHEAAPQMGNTEIPPDDYFTWRKYGQKVIQNSRFPRSYFRCTHQKLCNCPAKKQVQRLDNDPNTFEITYRGDHTCHLSSTAPTGPPPSLHHHNLIGQQADVIHHQQHEVQLDLTPPPPVFISQGLSMDIGNTTAGADVGTQPRGFMIGPTSSNIINIIGGGVAAGPSAARTPYGREHSQVEYLQQQQQQPVADMADAMFNSGSSSNNSMDLIFSSMDKYKWDSGGKKN